MSIHSRALLGHTSLLWEYACIGSAVTTVVVGVRLISEMAWLHQHLY